VNHNNVTILHTLSVTGGNKKQRIIISGLVWNIMKPCGLINGHFIESISWPQTKIQDTAEKQAIINTTIINSNTVFELIIVV
jgi:hypothetical protein